MWNNTDDSAGTMHDSQEYRWSWNIFTEGGSKKSLELVHGDICAMQAKSDVVVCSAFKNCYHPTKNTLIEALLTQRGISVENLASDPELDFRNVGCWLSHDTGDAFRRVACVELLTYAEFYQNYEQAVNTIIKRSFSTLRFLLEQASISDVPVSTVTMPILGSGEQQIDLAYLSAPLIAQCCSMLKSNAGVERILICDKSLEKVKALAEIMSIALKGNEAKNQVFISYSSKQQAVATEIRDAIRRRNISCWMAPESIPPTSSYQSIIPLALQEADVVLLVLTPDAEESRWVQKEIGSAIGANKKLLPYQLIDYPLGSAFRFLLDGEQIMHHEEPAVVNSGLPTTDKYSRLASQLLFLLDKQIHA